MAIDLVLANSSNNSGDVIVICYPGGHEETLARNQRMELHVGDTSGWVSPFWIEFRADNGSGRRIRYSSVRTRERT